ncbi:MAG: putative secreted hydrolase [Crocinitomicaceae bacterium]|jgi:predicted secreted hydrolase
MKTEERNKIILPSAIQLPRDQYAHTSAPTEWWWHIGTLVDVKTGQKFGFEINTATFYGAAFNQICLSDVKNSKHYQSFEILDSCPAGWAEYDTTKDWFVKLDATPTNPLNSSCVSMTAPKSDPTNMNVVASFTETSGKSIEFDLQLNQQGNELLVWGTGIHNVYPSSKFHPKPIQQNNYYYSLTNLKASGTITVDGVVHTVEGKTWMDHEYGAFPPSTKWLLADIQLDNGVSISNVAVNKITPTSGVPIVSKASILLENGESVYIPTKLTPSKPKTFGDYTFFMEMEISIDSPEHGIVADFTVKPLMENQIFSNPVSADIYEGVGSLTGTYNNTTAEGTVWIEQSLNKNSTK